MPPSPFSRGEHDQGLGRFEQALSQLRMQTGQRHGYFFGLAGLIYPIAIWRCGDAKQKNKLPALLVQALKNNSYWSGIYRMLELFFQFQMGDLKVRTALLSSLSPYEITNGFNAEGSPRSLKIQPLLSQVFFLLLKHWTKNDHFRSVPHRGQELYHHLRENGYTWLAAELAKIFAEIEPKKATIWDSGFFTADKKGLADLFIAQPFWQLALVSLSGLGKSGKQAGAALEKPARLIWLLSFDEKHQHIFLEPREQKRQSSGVWSKGRSVAMKRLALEQDRLDYLSEHDRRLCARIKAYRDSGWYHNNVTYAFSEEMPTALIGHPLLFAAQSPEVPLSAQDHVLQTLTDISGLLTVHSDIGGSSSNAEQVAADALALHSQKRDLADSLLEGAELSGKMSADDLLALMLAEAPS